MFWLITGLLVGAVIAFYLGKLPQFICSVIGLLIFMKIAMAALFFFIVGLMLFRPRYCCRRC